MQNYQAQERYIDEAPEQEVNIREYLLILRKRKFVVVTLLAVIFVITVITTFSTTPVYTSSAEVLVERNRASSGLENQYYSYEPEFLETQSAIIQSAKVARRVVESLKLATTYRTFFLDKKIESPSYFSQTVSEIKEFVDKIVSPLIVGSQNDKNQEGSPSVQLGEPLSDEDIIVAIIQGGLSVKPVKNTKIVQITYSDKSPAIAKLVTDAVTKAYMDEMLDMKLTTSRYALEWMTAKAQDERKKLEASEMAMQNYMRANDLVTVENKLAIFPQKLAEFGSQLSKAQTERKALEDVTKQINAAGTNLFQLENLPLFAGNEVLKRLREANFKARQNISEMAKKFGEKHPVMIKANDELNELVGQQRAEINRVIASTKNSYELAKSQEKNLEELFNSTKSEVLNLNEKFIQYSIMKRDVDANRVVYESLTASIKKEGVTEQSQSINIWVIKNAALPVAPSKPNKKRNLALGLLLGLMAGVGCAFLIEYLDNTVKSEKDLENRYGLTVLGSIERLKEKGMNIESYIVHKPLSPLAESYRLIRSGLLLSSADHPPRTMLITSMGPSEGKTSTTINIARVFSQGNKKVLIIDCDLRRPRVHSVFSMQNDKGLSNFLTGNLSENIIHKVAGEDIFVITSGTIPPNPSDLVGSKKLKILIEKMSENFDFVLIDSPPVQSVTDSLTLAQLVDGTVVVARAGVTTYDMIEGGLKKLKDTNCHFLGFVLNGQNKNHGAGAYYSGYSAYYVKDNVG